MTAPTPPTPPAGPPQEGGQGGQNGPQGAPSDPQGGQGAPTPPNGAQGGQGGDQRPPWERNGEAFDPERAWRQIQNMRTERDTLKTRAEEAEGKVSEAERAKMSDLERAQGDAQTATQRAETAEAKLARYEVAAEKGVPAEAVAYLTGTTKEELAASADGLLKLIGGGQGGQAPPTGRPTERLAPPPPGGADPNAPAVEMDPAKLADLIPRGL